MLYKIEQFKRNWINVYLNENDLNVDVDNNIKEISNLLFKLLEIQNDYENIIKFESYLKEFEFKGTKLEKEYDLLEELAKDFEENLKKTTEWNKIFNTFENDINTIKVNIKHEIKNKRLEEIKQSFIMSGDIDEFINDFFKGIEFSKKKIYMLNRDLIESMLILLHKYYSLYCLEKNFISHVLKKDGFSPIDTAIQERLNNIKKVLIKNNKNVIITAFSSASNYDMKKEDYFKRKDAVKIVEKNKPKSYKEGINLNKKLRSNEIEKNYTINYKNVYGNDIINKDPLLSKIINIINIHSSEQLKSLERFFLDNEENKKDEKLIESMDSIMFTGFNRVVIVDSNHPQLGFVEEVANKIFKSWDGKEYQFHESELDMYKQNIELIKYVNVWEQKIKINKLNLNNKSLIDEVLSHQNMLQNKSEKMDELKNLTTQQLNIKNVFTVERITLDNLAEKIRFLLYLDMAKDYKNHYLIKLNEKVENFIGPKRNPLTKILSWENIFSDETKIIEKLKLDIENNTNKDEIVDCFKANSVEVNNYLSKSLFIWIGLTWSDINKVFRENRLILSSGLNNKKQFTDPLSYKLSVLYNKILGDEGYKSIVKSFNSTNPFLSKMNDDINISEPKGFGKVNRVYALDDGNQSLLNESEIIKNGNDNVYLSLMNNGPDFYIKKIFDMKDEILKHKEIKKKKEQEEILLKRLEKEENKKKKKFNRGYHTIARNYNRINKFYDFHSSHNKMEKRLYSSNNIENHYENYSIDLLTKESFVKDKNNYFNSLSDKFLMDSSYLFSEIKKIIDNELNKGTDLKTLQDKIEKYTMYHEQLLTNDFILRDKDIGKHSKAITSLNNYALKRLEVSFINFTHSYYINDYKKLLRELKAGYKKVNFFLLFFVIEAEVERKSWEIINQIESGALQFNFKNKNSERKWIEKKINRNDNIKSINSIIIKIIARILFKFYSNNDNDSTFGLITQSELINRLGREIVKILPDKIPELFLNRLKKWTEDDIKFIKNYYSNNLYKESDEFKAEVGSTIFDIIINEKNNINLLKIDRVITQNKKKNIYITISDEFMDFFAKKIYSPYKLPMVVVPSLWINNKNNEGGYLNNDFKNFANSYLIHKSFKNNGDSEIGNIQIDTVNFLNKQEFKINKDMLNLLIKEYYVKSSILYNGLNELHPESIDNKLYSNAYKKNVLSHNSKFNLYNQVLAIAILFKNFTFYIPTYLDFRGRIYTEVDYFSYQAEDMAKSLIEFKNGCILNNDNIIYVLQCLANLAGKSKLTLKNKEKWSINLINKLNITTEELNYKNFNIDKITFKEEFLQNFNIEYLITNDFIKKILLDNDEKLQFLSVLFNFIESLIYKNKLFCSPICFDATCNGFQHLAAIFKDMTIANNANVVNDDEVPNDIYNNVAQNVEKQIIDMKNGYMKDKFLKIIFNRKLLKKPVMTVPYNVGLEKLQNQLINDGFFEERIDCSKENKNIKFFIVNKDFCKENVQLSWKEMGILSSILYKGVYNTFPNLSNYVNYMKNIAIIFSALNEPIEWITPVGMTIKMQYNKRNSKPSKSLYSKRRTGTVSLPLTKMDSISNKIAFMPNFIHSMDSTNIQLLINIYKSKKKEDINLLTIHDCFATTPNYMLELNRDVRLAFIMMYFQNDYIKTVHEYFLKRIYNCTKILYEKKENQFQKVEIKDINNLSLNVNKDYIIKTPKKFYTIPSLPYNVDNWDKIKNFFERVIESKYFIN